MSTEQTNVIFYFDPSCPFCWITSRWLELVGEHRDISVAWRPFSLALKNNELNGTESDDTTPHGVGHRQAHRVLRVIASAQQAGADAGKLYQNFGYEHFINEQPYDDDTIEKVLSTHKLSVDLAHGADDTTLDAELRASLDSALDIVGDDVGVPIIVFDNTDEKPVGFFGPVLQRLPDTKTALALWDGLTTLGTSHDFYELKRTRPAGGPDVSSTATFFDSSHR